MAAAVALRQPRPGEVLSAVEYVTGVDPRKRGRHQSTIAARRLAAQALVEVAELSQVEAGAWMGIDRTHVCRYLSQQCDYDRMRAVISAVSAKIESEPKWWMTIGRT